MPLALARKYRPKRFADVAVQSHVSTTLQGAIGRDRVAHGYLLCGPRGVGKTTIARVLAMALNCERKGEAGVPPGEPCGECGSCQRIWTGSTSLDVVEIDAASNRGVDDARALRERAMYAPSGDDRYKVYIVDEAHMLTREAWNALLKVLEEPPPRVVFVFATTEPQKIAQAAAPVLSRLQRFDLKRIGPGEIRERLASVLSAEQVDFDVDAVGLIARAADGSMRDALSLTDQVLAMGEGQLRVGHVRDALGIVPDDELIGLLDLLAERRAGDVFGFVGRLADAGVDFITFFGGFASMVRTQLALVLGAEVPDLSESTREALMARRERYAAADLVRVLSILTELEPRVRRSGQQQMLIEAALVRLAMLDRVVAVEELIRTVRGGGSSGGGGSTAPTVTPPAPGASKSTAPAVPKAAPAPAPAPAPKVGGSSFRTSAPEVFVETGGPPVPVAAPTPAPTQAPASVSAPTAKDETARATRALSVEGIAEVWDSLIHQFKVAGKPFVAGALANTMPVSVTAQGAILLALEVPNEVHGKAIEAASGEILEMLRKHFSPVIRVSVKGAARSDQPVMKRLTDEMLRAESLDALRKRSPVIEAAIETLELEIME